MANEEELSREKIEDCPFCKHDSEGKGGLYKRVVRVALTDEEYHEARYHHGALASLTRDYEEFFCAAGIKKCAIIKTHELAHRASTRDTSETVYGGGP